MESADGRHAPAAFRPINALLISRILRARQGPPRAARQPRGVDMKSSKKAAPAGAVAGTRKSAPAPAVALERATVMKVLHPIVEMLGSIVGPHTEVVLHDLMQPEHSIVAIANGHISNRTVGNAIIAGPKDDVGFLQAKAQLSVEGQAEHSIITDYPTATESGKRLKSATVIFRASDGIPYAALCLNADLTMFQATYNWLERFLQVLPGAAPQVATAQPDMDKLMLDIIDGAVHRFGKPVALMNREEKTHAVKVMMQRGLFIVKGGVEKAAASLEVSRYTIYNYMEAVRQRDGAGASVHAPEAAVPRVAAKAPAKKAGTRAPARNKAGR
jgi:predicted transcriptional regulator YheO